MSISNASITCLLVIRILNENHNDIYSIDIARKLHISRQSIYRTIKNLVLKNYIQFNNKSIRLTDEGKRVSDALYTKYQFFNGLIIKNNKINEINIEAINLAKSISDQTFNVLSKC